MSAVVFPIWNAVKEPGLLAFAINGIMFVISSAFNTEHLFDFTGSMTYITCALYSVYTRIDGLHSLHWRQTLLTGLLVVWALRLGVFLFYRVHKLKGDRRFAKMKKSILHFGFAWTLQAIWNIMVSLPLYVVLSLHEAQPHSLLDGVGVAMWLVGFVFEVTADLQKLAWQVRMGDARFTTVNRTGVWALCRYPNYFGEIMLQFGFWLTAIASFSLEIPMELGMAVSLLISPLFTAVLLLHVSGIPLQEAMAKKRFAGNKDYLDYCQSTNKLIPWFAKKLKTQ